MVNPILFLIVIVATFFIIWGIVMIALRGIEDEKYYRERDALWKKWKNVDFFLPYEFDKNYMLYVDGLLQNGTGSKLIKKKILKFDFTLRPNFIIYISDNKNFVQYRVNDEDYNKGKILKDGTRRIYIRKEK